jgi:hypothetical protein
VTVAVVFVDVFVVSVVTAAAAAAAAFVLDGVEGVEVVFEVGGVVDAVVIVVAVVDTDAAGFELSIFPKNELNLSRPLALEPPSAVAIFSIRSRRSLITPNEELMSASRCFVRLNVCALLNNSLGGSFESFIKFSNSKLKTSIC